MPRSGGFALMLNYPEPWGSAYLTVPGGQSGRQNMS